MAEKQGPCWRVGTLLFNLIAIPSIILFLAFAVVSLISGSIKDMLCFMLFVALDVVLLLMGGTTEMNDNYIRTFTLLGSYELAWTEITKVSVISDGLILFAPGKQLYVPSPKVWSGKDKHQACKFLVEKLELQNPPITEVKGLLSFSRNCKRKKATETKSHRS